MDTQNELSPEQSLRQGLLLAVQRNVFFDAVLASMAYTLLEEAFRKSKELRDYPYEQVDLATVPGEELKNYKLVTTILNDDTASIGTVTEQPDLAVQRIIDAINRILYLGSLNNPSRIVAGTLRMHIVTDARTGKLAIMVMAVKHERV